MVKMASKTVMRSFTLKPIFNQKTYQNHTLINRYNEVCKPGYTFGQESGGGGTGHFTQVVWKESVELGIGKADIDRDGMKCTYVVARYRPAGNMRGDYVENVPQGSFNKAQACAGVKRTITHYLTTRSKIHHKKDKHTATANDN